MSRLNYLHTDTGYELIFNRDEQHSRLPDIPPQFNNSPHIIRGMGNILKKEHSITSVSASKLKLAS